MTLPEYAPLPVLDVGWEAPGDPVGTLENIPPQGEALPAPATVRGLVNAIRGELLACESDRAEHMERVREGWDVYGLTAYDPDEMLLSEQQSLTLPTVRARVDQAHGSLYGALAITPFFQADVGEGQDGTVAVHAQAALGEELERCEFENALDVALRGSLVGTIGILKATTLEGESGGTRLDVEAVDIRDLYLSPHNVRDLQQCTMIAHAYTETLGWARDQALAGVFSMEAVRLLAGGHAHDRLDGGGSERAQHGLPEADSLTSEESRKVEMLECYVKYRPRENPDQPLNPNARRWQASEMWRVFVERKTWTVLRAEPWDDGFPFLPLRHQRGQTTIYAPSFPSILKDIQWTSDMLTSSIVEAAAQSVAPVWEVGANSLAMEWIKNRKETLGGETVRIKPGDILPRRGAAEELRPMYFQPPPMQLEGILNRLENIASLATITVQPMQTYRSATEHRYAMASVTAKEQQMLKVLRADLTRAGEYLKRLYWKYCAGEGWTDPATGAEMKQVRHGTVGYNVSALSWGMVRLTPRGMTTQADQMMTMQATQEALGLQMQVLPQKPMLEQAGLWPLVWYAMSRRLEALGIQDWEKYIGPNPVTDPNEVSLDPFEQQKRLQASMLLMQANNPAGGAGVMQAMQGGMLPGGDGGVRASDGAPTVPPGGAPMPGGVN